MVRSSLPFSSPLMTTDFPMFTMSFSMDGSGLGSRTRSPRLGWRGRLRRSRRLSARRSDRFIAFPHVILRLSSSQGARVCRVCRGRMKSPASIWNAPKRCLVLLLPRVSGSATMNGSLCVSILTTTRRPRSRPRWSRPSSPRHARPVRQRVERASLRPARQSRHGRCALGGRRADPRRPVGDRLHERRHRVRTTSRSAAPPRRSSPPDAVISSRAPSNTKPC